MHKLLKPLLLLLILLCANTAHAVYVEKMPVNQIQPNGDTVHFFVTGDEYYHRYHDENGFTILQAQSGFWVYAEQDGKGSIQPSQYRVGTVNPASLGLPPNLSISKDEWHERIHAWDIPEQYRIVEPKSDQHNHGDYCNLVIFIRFADDTAYSRSLSSIDKMFSDSSSASATSVYNYFKHVSYNQLFVRTYYAPEPDSDMIVSYQSPYPRGYYMPYTDHNTVGYTDYSERTQREFDLLVGAVNFVNDFYPVPTSYNLDCDNNGFIDNVNFVVKGSYTGWSDLLWPHKWNLYGHDVFINGKQVNTFNFALEGAGEDYFGTSTFCHEMFHSLGAPDLYHYNHATEIAPVGSWDLMASNSKPPQNMSAYMKYKYGTWFDSIPLITQPGTYTLNSVSDSLPGTNILLFPSAHPDQFYAVEYRDNTEVFDKTIPGKGLLIYRIDRRFNGNAEYDGENYLDEVWLFRPGSNSPDASGSLSEAYFTPQRHRTEFSPSTNPYPYLSDGTPDYSFSISNINLPGNTVSFRYTNRTAPANLHLVRATTATATVSWNGVGNAYRVCYRPYGTTDAYRYRLVHTNNCTLTGLEPNALYEYAIRALFDPIDDNNYQDSSRLSPFHSLHTELCNNSTTLTIGETTNNEQSGAPFAANQKYNYTQELFLASEIDCDMDISTIQLHYAHTTPLDKPNCTIYMALTDVDNLTDTVIPAHQLTQVFSGDITLSQGWNEIVLDTPFPYHNTHNLIVAFDDNSGTPSRFGNKFYCHSTDQHLVVNYSSNDENIGPEQDTLSGTRSRLYYRNNFRFTGCPNNNSTVYACIISDNDEQGRVSGEGAYNRNQTIQIFAFPNIGNTFKYWNDGVTDNPRDILLTQDTIFIAYFHSSQGISDTPSGYLLLTQGLNVTVQGAEQQPIAIYDIMGRPIAQTDHTHTSPATFTLPSQGIYLLRIGNNKPIKLLVK